MNLGYKNFLFCYVERRNLFLTLSFQELCVPMSNLIIFYDGNILLIADVKFFKLRKLVLRQKISESISFSFSVYNIKMIVVT